MCARRLTRCRRPFKPATSPPFAWSLNGLPAALATTLRAHFLSVDLLSVSRSLATEGYDLIAKMSVDHIHFDGANTTGRRDRVNLTMTFTVEQPNGTEVFQTTVSGSASNPYTQPCTFCKPDPREAFIEAFSAVFAKLSETLSVSDIRFVQERRL